MSIYNSPVYNEINKRLLALSIDLNDYIYVNPTTKRSTLTVEKTTLDGISFVAGVKINNNPFVLGSHTLKYRLINAKKRNGLRAFVGQIHKEDLANLQLQGSFLATDGEGFREVFDIPNMALPLKNANNKVLLNQDNRFFDTKFGKMVDSPDITSIHVDMAKEGGLVSIHLDKEGFVFSDIDGKIYLSSNVVQHVLDELILKSILLGNGNFSTAIKNHVTIFSHLNHNSLSDPTYNPFLRYSSIRSTLGIEASYSINNTQLFARGSLGLEISNDKKLDILKKEFSSVIGLRRPF